MARPPRLTHDPLEAAREELKRLRAADDWDDETPMPNRLTPVVHVHAFPPPPARPSPPPVPHPGPPPLIRSVAPRTPLELAWAASKRFPPWGFVLVVIVALLVYAYLALHGKAPVPP